MTRRAIRRAVAVPRMIGRQGCRQSGGPTGSWQDKRGSPSEPQAIAMAWVRACLSVGARAARKLFFNWIKRNRGTAGALAAHGGWL
jgi:hypothetical protein